VSRDLPISKALPLDAILDGIGTGPLALGIDLGTTTGKTSNPTSLALVEADGIEYAVRLAARWKTDKGDVTKGLVLMLCAELVRRGKALRVVHVDASNERFFAADLRNALAGLVRCDLAVFGTNVMYRGESLTLKARACARVEMAAQDNRLRLPAADWVRRDLRQMVKEAGRYEAAVEADGSHADFFIALALALDALDSTGPADAIAVPLSARPRVRGWDDDEAADDEWTPESVSA
jgi:hypothetical protein